METSPQLIAVLLFLFVAVLMVPLARKLGIGAVLGYLIAGIAIGPWGFRLIDDVDEILHFSEMGVVLLLFVIGLELNPAKLWKMRKPIFGLGTAQVLLTTGILCGLLYWAGFWSFCRDYCCTGSLYVINGHGFATDEREGNAG